MKTSILAIAFVVACSGGGKKADTANTSGDTASTTSTTSSSGDGVYGGAAYGGYTRTAELTELHDLVASRTTSAAACPASGDLHDAAVRIAKHGPPPGANPDMWNGESEELVVISEDLQAHCSAGASTEADYDVASMHRSFQRLLLQLGP